MCRSRLVSFVLSLAGILALTRATEAQSRDTLQAMDTLPIYRLGGISVKGRVDNLASIAVSASQGFVGARDLRLRPLSREGELLETVPGLIMTQHSGDGKANQMFVRGFNLDHGTDFETRLEGMPVNVVTHAHGQGYTDLNFVIPELVDYIDYRLGTYYAGIGDFGAAGGAEFRMRRSLDRPFMTSGVGANGFARIAAGASLPVAGGSLLAGGEVKGYDGPWDLPENLRKVSGLLRWSRNTPAGNLSILALGYDNRWNASDQIPLRLVQQGVIDRFAQVDSTLGGASYRYSLSGEWTHGAASGGGQRIQAFAIRSDLDLFSNFTYFLEGMAGDQIRQRDRGRWTIGANATHVQPLGEHRFTLGLQTRYDIADVALYRSHARVPVTTVRRDDVHEWGTGLFVEAESRWTARFRSVLGLRGDVYRFDVASDNPVNSGRTGDAILSPKASLVYQPGNDTEVYLSAGLGFHSNDARGTTQRIDPSTGDPVDPVDPLVRSLGGEIGLRASPLSGLRSTLVLWTVRLNSELVFVGDAGTTEPSDASRRVGFTTTNFWRVSSRLAADLDVSVTRARFQDVLPDANRIPGAIENVVSAGLAWNPDDDGVLGSIRLRHLGGYPLTEDGSVRGDPTSVVNMSAGWRRGPVQLTLSILNLFDAAGADIQYYYASRVSGEPVDGVQGVHFHPIEPRQLRLALGWGF
jgi:TonB dependent receptor-like, beta-barrel/TonB-dependent Receptor Plug Domain